MVQKRVAAFLLSTLSTILWVQTDNSAVSCGRPSTARVSEIYPTSDVLPENLLRFYVYFNAPMRADAVLPEVVLSDELGREIEGAFLLSRHDLWSEDRTRLTLLLNPGRVKTGLLANEHLGRAIENGRSYTLTIGAEAQDESGCPLASAHTKHFAVAESDLNVPAPHLWTVQIPVAGTRNLLRVSLHDTFDHVSLAYRIRVQTLSGESVPGRISVAAFESEWRFAPASPWQAGDLVLNVDPVLEDLAGNRPTGLFDDPTGDSRQQQASATPIHVPFSISPHSEEEAKYD